MSNLLAFAKYVPHHVAVETLVMVIAIVIIMVIVILLLHGCGDMAVVR
jgi:heme/copper-type cytochrome/quinol oxidase subunit 2